jgi:lysyl-tRNA synthetase, class II
VRRKRRAWQLAVALVAASALAHLAKGLDFEEAFFSLFVLAALWRHRGEFTAPGDPDAVRPTFQAVAGVGGAALLLTLRVWETFGPVADLTEDALAVLAAALAVRAVYLWLRPIAHRVEQTVEQRARAVRLVAEHGRDSLSYFSLRRDKSYFFSPTGRSFLAYRVVNGTALVSGDPIGERGEVQELLAEFRRLAQSRGWRFAVVGAGAEALPVYHALGLRSIYLGDEAVVDPSAFSLEGRKIRKVRQSVTRLDRGGFRVRILAPDAVDAGLRRELAAVSNAWRGAWPERGFGMAMDALFAYEDSVLAVAEAPDGRVGGFVQLVPAPASGGWSLATMRRRPGTPNGLTEFLLVRVLEWAREQGVSEVSLNFAVFGQVLRGRSGAFWRRSLRAVLMKLDRLFQLDRLLSFTAKFGPSWRARYICIERLSDFPLVGLAYLHAESLLTPPGPWTRAADLANH